MLIRWNIDTGYLTTFPDWEIEIPDEELVELTSEEVEARISEEVQEKFEQTISWVETGRE